MRRILVATATVALVAMVAAGASSAARTTDTITCGGTTYVLTVTSVKSDKAPAWGVGTISGGDHLIPTSFSFQATDLTSSTVLFSGTQAKGNGNGQHNQAQISCGTSQTATAGELGGIPGVSDSDLIQFTFTVTGVRKP